MRVLFVAALLGVLAPAVPAAQEITRPRHLTLHAGEIYFITGSTGAIDLWRTDGTSGGTVTIARLSGVIDVTRMVSAGTFVALTAGMESGGSAVWRTDGTAAGTLLLRDFDSQVCPSAPAMVTVFRGDIVFVVGAANGGNEIWRSDGTPGGTLPVEEFEPSPPQCLGDCDATGVVTSADLRVLVDLVLSGDSSHSCPPGDRNRDLVVTVDEVVAAVLQARGGC